MRKLLLTFPKQGIFLSPKQTLIQWRALMATRWKPYKLRFLLWFEYVAQEPYRSEVQQSGLRFVYFRCKKSKVILYEEEKVVLLTTKSNPERRIFAFANDRVYAINEETGSVFWCKSAEEVFRTETTMQKDLFIGTFKEMKNILGLQ